MAAQLGTCHCTTLFGCASAPPASTVRGGAARPHGGARRCCRARAGCARGALAGREAAGAERCLARRWLCPWSSCTRKPQQALCWAPCTAAWEGVEAAARPIDRPGVSTVGQAPARRACHTTAETARACRGLWSLHPRAQGRPVARAASVSAMRRRARAQAARLRSRRTRWPRRWTSWWARRARWRSTPAAATCSMATCSWCGARMPAPARCGPAARSSRSRGGILSFVGAALLCCAARGRARRFAAMRRRAQLGCLAWQVLAAARARPGPRHCTDAAASLLLCLCRDLSAARCAAPSRLLRMRRCRQRGPAP